jgi:radical SAM superfamily enzyme YgiQ (UPF0313 family)
MPQFISNHGLRMVEAALRTAGLEDLELKVWDLSGGSAAELVSALVAWDPDVVGFSAYIWSFPFFVDVARELKRDDPSRLIVFGGPSARPSMFGLLPFRAARRWVDALAINDGEHTFAQIVAATDRSAESLAGIPGLALPTEQGWQSTPERPLADLDTLASPYELGVVPGGGLAVLQTYRGCPMTCSFCEWGTLESPRRVRGVAQLEREFSGMAALDVQGAILVDAGLNLNPHAFRNLREAVERHGFLRERGIGQALVGIGLQSFDNGVLAHVERSYDERRFEDTLWQLKSVSKVAVEIILGLPGDTPENFRRSFERARALPVALRVYHCVVLPSALMVRAPASYAMDFDPVTLKMRACLGWTAQSLRRECEHVAMRAAAEGGRAGEYFWIFPPPGEPY